jgi:hypothetical protein
VGSFTRRGTLELVSRARCRFTGLVIVTCFPKKPPPRTAGTGTPARRKAQPTLGWGRAWTGPVAGVARLDADDKTRCRSAGTACNDPPATDTRMERVHLDKAARGDVEQRGAHDDKARADHR